MSRPEYLEQTSLASLTTLGIGGSAHRVARVPDHPALLRALEENAGLPVAVLGSGSNLLVADRGYAGMLLQSSDQLREYDPATGELQVGAGLGWDELVSVSVATDAAGLECLAGIPGLCGAAPVQNIGAYGQEVAEVITGLTAVDLTTGQSREFSLDECGFAYRRSRFKCEEAGRWMIMRLRMRLRPGGPPTLAYAELAAAVASSGPPSLGSVRDEVLRLRRSKSMVYDPADPNHRSAGSFFTNPVVSAETAEEVARTSGKTPPAWPTDEGRVKLAAAWLIQEAGFARGYRSGKVGLSTRHVLALVNLGGATASELLGLARGIRDRVHDRFGIRLRPEPVPLGFEPGEVEDLWGTQAGT